MSRMLSFFFYLESKIYTCPLWIGRTVPFLDEKGIIEVHRRWQRHTKTKNRYSTVRISTGFINIFIFFIFLHAFAWPFCWKSPTAGAPPVANRMAEKMRAAMPPILPKGCVTLNVLHDQNIKTESNWTWIDTVRSWAIHQVHPKFIPSKHFEHVWIPESRHPACGTCER